MKPWREIFSAMILVTVVLSSCAPATMTRAAATPTAPIQPQDSSAATVAPFLLTSTAFEPGGPIPAKYSCHGDKVSPPLAWSAVPAGTKSFALTVEDPDAVKLTGKVWDHWVIFNIPATATSLPEGLPTTAQLPDGSRQGQNSSGGLGYTAPCPPSGQSHSYVFILYALGVVLDLTSGATKDALKQAIDGHIFGQTPLVGHYASP